MAAEGVSCDRSIYTRFVALASSEVATRTTRRRRSLVFWMAIHDRKPCSEQTGGIATPDNGPAGDAGPDWSRRTVKRDSKPALPLDIDRRERSDGERCRSTARPSMPGHG